MYQESTTCSSWHWRCTPHCKEWWEAKSGISCLLQVPAFTRLTLLLIRNKLSLSGFEPMTYVSPESKGSNTWTKQFTLDTYVLYRCKSHIIEHFLEQLWLFSYNINFMLIRQHEVKLSQKSQSAG